MREQIFGVFLRPDGRGDIHVEAIMTTQQVADRAGYVHLRLRYQPEIHASWMRLPCGTTAEQCADAIEAMDEDERWALYNKFAEKFPSEELEENA
jgi:hypothetical protein